MRQLITVLASFALLLCHATSAASGQAMSLFDYPVEAKSSQSGAPGVSVNRAIRSAAVGQQVELKLPNGELLIVDVTNKDRKANGTVVVNAQNSDGVELVLTVGKKASFASISGPELSYSLGFDPSSGHYLTNTEEARAALNFEGDMRFPPGSQARFKRGLPKTKNQSSALPDRQNNFALPADMTLLVVYSAEFGVGFGDPVARIEQLVAFTNQALSSTGVDGQFRLVATEQLNFDNGLGIGTLLDQATCFNPNDCANTAFSGLANLRDSVGADMVSVLSFTPGFSAAGVAWVNGDSPNFAFSSTRLSPGCCDSVFAHELGHNLGSGHERDSVNPTDDSCDDSFQPGGFNGFSCGFGSQSAGFGTIMSRLNGRVNRFSNPNQVCNGLPCGIPQGQANAADNFTSFNQSVFLIENFRANVTTPGSGGNGNGGIIVPIIPLLLDDT